MDIEIVMKKLYDSEINSAISSMWGTGWDVKLGDEMNGFVAEGNFRTLDEAGDFLDRQARRHFSESLYSLGKLEHDRRQTAGAHGKRCQRLNKDEIEEVLREDWQRSKEHLSEATAIFIRTAGETGENAARLTGASTNQSAAREQLVVAMHRLNQFLLFGTVPEELIKETVDHAAQ